MRHGGKARRRVAWADLPEDMLGGVLLRLPSFGDRARFRAVCRAWRAAWRSQPHPPAPWLATPGHCVSLPDSAIHLVWSLPEDALAARCRGSAGNWIALVPADGPCRSFLLNPFSAARIPLPPWMEEGPILKIAMSSAPQSDSESWVIAAVAGCTVKNRRRIAVCRPGDGQGGAWEHVPLSFDDTVDILFYEGKLHALRSCGRLVVFDGDELDLLRHEPREHQLPPPVAELSAGYQQIKRNLVECKGRLLMVANWSPIIYGRVQVDVHALEAGDGTAASDDGSWSWVRVKGIVGHALFVGDACSSAFPAVAPTREWCSQSQAKIIEDNRVYFAEDDRRLYAYRLRNQSVGLYQPSEWSAPPGTWRLHRVFVVSCPAFEGQKSVVI